MVDTIKSRTQKFIRYKGITMKDFELACNLSTGYVTSMRKGYGSEKLNNVLKAFPELNRDWLLYGEGEMLNTSSVPSFAKLSSETSCVSESAICAKFIALLEKKDEQIDRLLSLLEKLR